MRSVTCLLWMGSPRIITFPRSERAWRVLSMARVTPNQNPTSLAIIMVRVGPDARLRSRQQPPTGIVCLHIMKLFAHPEMRLHFWPSQSTMTT